MDDEVIGLEEQPYENRQGDHTPKLPPSVGQKGSASELQKQIIRQQYIGPPGKAIKPGEEGLDFVDEAIFGNYQKKQTEPAIYLHEGSIYQNYGAGRYSLEKEHSFF